MRQEIDAVEGPMAGRFRSNDCCERRGEIHRDTDLAGALPFGNFAGQRIRQGKRMPPS